MAEVVTWDDVLACFADRSDPAGTVNRLTAEWAGRYGATGRKIGPESRVTRSVWTAEQVGSHLDRLAKIVPALITDTPPRRLTGPLVLVDFGTGKIGQIDGRRRANVWRNMPGEYEVLTICAY